MSKHILDLKSKPNLGYGVNIKKVESENTKKNSHDIKPRMPIKKQIKTVKDLGGDKTGFTKNDIYNIWGAKRDTSKFDRTNSKSMKPFITIIFVLFVIAVVSFLGWNVFNKKPMTGDGVKIDISGDDSVISGARTRINIKYENKEPVKIKDVELRINYPEGIYYISSNAVPDNLGMNLWKLGDLKPGQNGKISLDIQVIGNQNDEINLEAIVAYEPSNFNSNFESKVIKKIKIEKSLMELSIDSPSEISNNNRVSYKITYKNISDQNLSDFRLRLEYPSNFSIIETAGQLNPDSENSWLINDLKKGDGSDVVVSGFLDMSSVTTSTFNAFLEIKSLYSNETSLNSEGNIPTWLPYIKVSKDILNSPSDASLKISVNNNQIDTAVNWSDELKYEIYYKNNTDKALENISITTKLDSKYLDWQTFKDSFNGVLDKKNFTITWDKNSIPSFAKLEKGQEGKINFSIKLNKFDDKYVGSDDYFVKSESSLNHSKISDSKNIVSNFIINKINTPISLSAKVRYYDEKGNAVGSGPLPPVVGEATTYEVVWSVKSKMSDLSEVSIRSVLPPNIDFGDIGLGDNIVYNSETREVVWQIVKLEKGKEGVAKFNIAITPDANQKGKIATLINQTNLIGLDSYSNSKINISVPYLTTELLGDKKASGKSKIIDL